MTWPRPITKLICATMALRALVTCLVVAGATQALAVPMSGARRPAALSQRGAHLARASPRLAAASPAPLKVAVAGAGVGGLVTALCLLKKGMDVTVYERTEAFRRFGGPIQFASNALSTLHAVDPALLETVMEHFTFTGTRTCGIKDGLRSEGFSMAPDSIEALWDASKRSDWYVRFPLKECADLFQLPYTGVIDRPDLQDVLLDACRALKPDLVVHGTEVKAYSHEADGGVAVTLSSGEVVRADALVGADGIWSTVRAQMYGEELKKPEAGGRVRQGCTYSGYTVFAGEGVLDLPDYYDTGYKVYIGPGRYFVTSDVGDGRVQWCARPLAARGARAANGAHKGLCGVGTPSSQPRLASSSRAAAGPPRTARRRPMRPTLPSPSSATSKCAPANVGAERAERIVAALICASPPGVGSPRGLVPRNSPRARPHAPGVC